MLEYQFLVTVRNGFSLQMRDIAETLDEALEMIKQNVPLDQCFEINIKRIVKANHD